jgi:hypothetical protein
VTCSIGAFWSVPGSVGSPDELVRQADKLMYEAKRLGRNRCVFKAAAEGGTSEDAAGAGQGGGAVRQRPAEAGGDPHGWKDLEELRGVAHELNAQPVDDCAATRKEPRKDLVAPCSLHYFTGRDAQVRTVRGVTRNLSTGGAGIVTTQVFSRGEAVELELNKGQSKLYLAGLVSFCRPVRSDVYELGIQFVIQSLSPGISGDAAGFLQRQTWAAQSLQQKQEGKLARAAATE